MKQTLVTPKRDWKQFWQLPRTLWVIVGLVALATFVLMFCIGLSSDRSQTGEILFHSTLGALGMALAGVMGIILIRWMVRGQNLRRAAFALACLFTTVAVFYAEENWRGKRAWEKYKKAQEAKGEQFDVQVLAPPAVPDDQNLAMVPLLLAPLDYRRTAEGVRWNDTNALARVHRFRACPDVEVGNHPVENHLEKGIFLDLEPVRAAYRRLPEFPQPAVPGTAAQDVLAGLARFDAEFKELHEAASRPEGRFRLEYDCDPPAAILLPHLAPLRSQTKNLQIRAIARLETRQAPSAFNDLHVALRLSDSVKAEPFLISHRVRIETLLMDLQVIREGLFRHAWTDTQLSALQRELAPIDLLAECCNALQGERAMEVSDVDWCRRQGFRFDPSLLFRYPTPDSGTLRVQLIRFFPSGWFYQNMLTLARLHDQYSFPSLDEKARRIRFEKFQSPNSWYPQWLNSTGPYQIFVQFLMLNMTGGFGKTAEGQTYLDAARVACALERYRLATGRLPDQLETLTPTYLDRIPTDVVDGQPLRYRLNPNGSYVIYSIGWNQKDDHGDLGIVKVIENEPVLDKSKSDWAWQLPVR